MRINIQSKTNSVSKSLIGLLLPKWSFIQKSPSLITQLIKHVGLQVLLVLTMLLGALPATAAVNNIVMVVIPGKSGEAPFDNDDLPGHDKSGDNNIVRTYDRFDYRVTYNALDLNQVNFVFTAPAGVYWLSSGANTSVCNGTGGPVISGGGSILTCPRKPASIQVESFELPAIAGNIANATEFTIAVAAGSASATSQSLKISAVPRTEIYVSANGYNKTTVNGNFGASYGIALRPGIPLLASGAGSGTIKGMESPKVPLVFTLSVLPPGTIVTSCPGTCTQPGGPGTPITISLSNTNNVLVSSGGVYGNSNLIANFKEFSFNSISLFTPFGTNFPSGSLTPLNIQFKNFAPESLSGVANYLGGQASGYAANVAPGYASNFTACPDVHSCIRLNIDRRIKTDLYTHFHGTFHTPTNGLIFGDNEASTNNNGSGAESVLPGHFFTIMYPITNSTAAEEAAHNLGSCVVWDPAEMALQGRATLKKGSGGEFFRTTHLSFPNVVAADHILEYSSKSYASDTARRNAACGVAGDGSADWSTDPAAVAGGMSAVSSIRYKYTADMSPGVTIGLMAPFQRPLTTFSLNAAYMTLSPWFMQFWADEKARSFPSPYGGSGLSGYGGRVNFVNALFRHDVSASATSIAPGAVMSLTVKPIAIGAGFTGVDATVQNAKIRVNMPDTCLEPVAASLPSFATLTPANYGADGLACTGDAGETAAFVVFSLGNIAAPGGPTTSGYQGKASFQPSFTFNIQAAPKSPVKTVTWTSVDSADNDPTPVTHNKSGNVAIAGVAAFAVSKTTSGTTNGKVGPNETFNYIINFSNGGSSSSGKARFVDVLPFDGDSRGTTGLGTGKMVVTGLNAAMASASQGTVSMEVSTDNPSTIESAIAVAGQEDGSVGVNWSPYTAGSAFPANVTAVRFTTSSDLRSGFSGFGSIQVKAPNIKSSTTAFNNVWGRTDAFLGDTTTIKIMRGAANLKIQGIDGATLRGRVFVDLDSDGVIDGNEVGLPNTLVSITCTAGACLTAPQGTSFSLKTDSAGGFSFEPNLANKVFANSTATGTALAVFDGTVAGTWTITETPPSSSPFLNVSTKIGTINTLPSGTAAGRSITGIAMVGGGVGINYLFGERLEHGKITVTKALTFPSNVTGPFNFTFTATCDKPAANSVFTATLTNFPTNKTVDIVNIPADASCVMSETTPAAPNGYGWATPTFSAFSPTGTMAAAGTQTVTATNTLVQGVTVNKSVVGTPTVVSGQPTQFDVKYKIEVKNTTPEAVTYSVADTFGFDADVEVVGTPTITASSNVSSTVSSSFTGSGSNKNIVTNESIAAGTTATPTIESFEIAVRVNIKAFTVTNNTCSTSTGAGAGLSNTATLSVNGIDTTSTTCTNTPVPATGKITVTKSLTRPSDVTADFNFEFKATCDLPAANSVFSATLTGFPGTNKVDILNIPAGATCTVTEVLPAAPNAYSWGTPTIGALSPSGAMTPNGTQSLTVTNTLVNGLTVGKTVASPVAVSGQPDQFDVTYNIKVTNSTASAISYDLTDTFGFDTDIEVVGTPSITKSSNVSSTVNSGFNGKTSTAIVTGESIAAATGTPLVPVDETFAVKVRVKVAGFTASNNACSGTGTGLFNMVSAKVGGVTRSSSVCTTTPDAQNGKIVVNASVVAPSGAGSSFVFKYKATCDKPAANSEFTGELTFTSTNKQVEIPSIPAGATCTVTQVLPAPPPGFKWKTPVISALSPTGAMPAGGSQSLTVDNELVQGFSIAKTVVGSTTAVSGQPTQFDITYKIEVTNTTDAAVTYSVSDTFGFDADVSLVGSPTITTSSNVTKALTTGFKGSAGFAEIIKDEVIDAAASGVNAVETYTVKLRFQVTGFNKENDTCTNKAGEGLLNTASASFGGAKVESSACSNTPQFADTKFNMAVEWEGGRQGAKVKIPGVSFGTNDTGDFESENTSINSISSSKQITVVPGQTGRLATYTFVETTDSPFFRATDWECSVDGTAVATVPKGQDLTIPVSAVGKNMICKMKFLGLGFIVVKSATPEAGTSIAVGDEIKYDLTMFVNGAATVEPTVLTDTLGDGLELQTYPKDCKKTGKQLICSLPADTPEGEYVFSYMAKVSEAALKVGKVVNKVTSTVGGILSGCEAADKCTTEHPLWSVDTQKVSDADGKKGVRIGDPIRYTVSVTIQNGPSSKDIKIVDTRSVGLEVSQVPAGCTQEGLVMTCILAKGAATGVHLFEYTAVVTKDAGDYVSNEAVADQGTCNLGCTTKVKVFKDVVLRVTKTSANKLVKIADFVRYQVLVENLSQDTDAENFFVIDKPAPGLHFVEGSVRVAGDDTFAVEAKYPLKIVNLDLQAGKKLTISYLMRVGAGAGRGKLSNLAWAAENDGYVTSNQSIATVVRGSDPDFEDTHIVGVVFEDLNSNGIHDESEPGVAGARLTTAQGLIIETDAFGRYHIEGIDPGASARGSNFILKLDMNSVPKGSKMTTQNPLVKRLTQGVPVMFNFGFK